MSNDAAARYAEQRKLQRQAIRLKVAQARAESSKQPFDFALFASLYDVSQDYGQQPITPEIEEHYEEQYYIGVPSATTIQEFAARKEELKLHDAN